MPASTRAGEACSPPVSVCQLEDWERLVEDGLKLPRCKQYIRLYAAHADAPLTGRVVTQYPDTRQNANAIFDYTHVAMKLMAIWANRTHP